MAFSSMSAQSASSMRMLTLSTSPVSKRAVSYSIVTPESPAAAVMLSEKAAAQKQRQTAMAITAATIRVICLDAIMLLPPYPMYSPL